MMSFGKISFVALLCTLIFGAASCVVQEQAAGPRGAVSNQKYNRVSGSLTAKLGCSMFEADKAVRASAKKLQLIELSHMNQQQDIVYEYKNIYEDRVDVTVKPSENGTTAIYIKLGKCGDRNFSRKLLKEIASRIPVSETAVIEDEAPAEEE